MVEHINNTNAPAEAGDAPRAVGVLENDEPMRELICRFLTAERLDAIPLKTGAEALDAVLSNRIDVILIDLGLGSENGMEVVRRIRARSKIPVIVVSGWSEVSHVTAALDAGADDYVRKPVPFDELAARLRSVWRRKGVAPETALAPAVVRVGDLVVDLASSTATGSAGSQHLTERESLIFSILAQHAGRAVTRDAMCRALLGEGWQPSNRLLDVHISNLRTKLERAGAPKWIIRTRRNVGYELVLQAPAAADLPTGTDGD